MLATLADHPFSREGWLFEPKLDGERCLAFRHGDSVNLFSRNHKPLNLKYPELVNALQVQKTASFIVDGEIVAFDGGVSSFGKLQQRMQAERPSIELQRNIPVSFYAFDLLHLETYDTRHLQLRYRKQLLRQTLYCSDIVRFTEHCEANGESFYRDACRKRWEGIIAKNAESIYVSRRSRDWLKFKCVNQQEFVIGGYSDPKGQRIRFGALQVGYYDSGKLVYAGKVGTRYDVTTLRRLGAQLSALETDTCPFVHKGTPQLHAHWVEPKLVAQIGFTAWTAAGKLRQPRFIGLRMDKRPQEVVREK